VPRQRDFGHVDPATHGLVELPVVERHGMLWVQSNPNGSLDLEELLGGLGAELESWRFGDYQFGSQSEIDRPLNWKLANDTFGETYHFERLHADTLGQLFYGDALSYETFGRNHRFVFPLRDIDALRELPQSEWKIGPAANVLYYLFPNVQFNVGPRNLSLVRIYPSPGNPGQSLTRVTHYYRPNPADANERTTITATNVYDSKARTEGKVEHWVEASVEVFNSTIEKEDYAMGESIQRSIASGAVKSLLFGRNEPALHHFHNTFRAVLDLLKLSGPGTND
jgi:phenylpropionate dioxygenase-like ring-hydroxylating dioxygenase large terminal subunit